MKINGLLAISALIMTLFPAFSNAYAQESARDGGMDWKVIRQHREEVLAQLPPEKAKLYKDAMHQVHEKNQALRDQIEKMHAEIKALMTADTFNKSDYLAKNAEMEKLYAQMRTNMLEAITSVAAQFTLEERKTLTKLHMEPEKHDSMPHKGDTITPQPAK